MIVPVPLTVVLGPATLVAYRDMGRRDLVDHVSTCVTETVYRHEVRPALSLGATALNKILKKQSKTA